MAENKICKMCGHPNSPDAQFCQMCFAPFDQAVGGSTRRDSYNMTHCNNCGRDYDSMEPYCPFCNGKSSAGKGVGGLIGVIIGTVIEVLFLVSLIIFAVNKVQSWEKPPIEHRPADPAYVQSQQLEQYLDSFRALGNDMTNQYGIDSLNNADYNAPNIASMNFSGFNCLVPTGLFCSAIECNVNNVIVSYGAPRNQVCFVGNDGTYLEYLYVEDTYGYDKDALVDMLSDDAQNIITKVSSDTLQSFVNGDSAEVLLEGIGHGPQGTQLESTQLATVVLYRVEGQNVLRMTFQYPDDGSSSTQKNGVATDLANALML